MQTFCVLLFVYEFSKIFKIGKATIVQFYPACTGLEVIQHNTVIQNWCVLFFFARYEVHLSM